MEKKTRFNTYAQFAGIQAVLIEKVLTLFVLCFLFSLIITVQLSELPVNYVIKQIVELVTAQEGKDVNSEAKENENFECIHQNFVSNHCQRMTQCEHCAKQFCQPCSIVHKEQLKKKIDSYRSNWVFFHRVFIYLNLRSGYLHIIM